MRVIYRWPLPPGPTTLPMPQTFRLLTVGWSRGEVCLWAEHGDGPVTERTFTVYGTGHPMPDDPGTYVGSAVSDDLTFHVYEASA